MIHHATSYLERNRICKKHHVEHTGSNAYLLDFYDYLGEFEKGKKLISYLLTLIVDSPEGAKVFYPGHLNPMNMSQNVIDTGTAVDTISRFAANNREAFSEEEHARIIGALTEVIETYLAEASRNKQITNQRLWGLTGVASYARYIKSTAYNATIKESIERAFADMTEDGFFRYYPGAKAQGDFEGYDAMSAFYQSRHIAFIRYALSSAGIPDAPYAVHLEKAERALLSMYTAEGVKDMRMECKRWYWQTPYEVASHSFDAYALATSVISEAEGALNNVLYQVRRHFRDGHLHAALGPRVNFQCPIFWTAHLAWVLRIPGIEARFDAAKDLVPFVFDFSGKDVHTHTAPGERILINASLGARNPSTGIFDNGLPDVAVWSWRFPKLPPRLIFSTREMANHTWYALRGFHFLEAALRVWCFLKELFVLFLPRYSTRYGKLKTVRRITDRTESGGAFEISVIPATKYGTVAKDPLVIHLPFHAVSHR